MSVRHVYTTARSAAEIQAQVPFLKVGSVEHAGEAVQWYIARTIKLTSCQEILNQIANDTQSHLKNEVCPQQNAIDYYLTKKISISNQSLCQ